MENDTELVEPVKQVKAKKSIFVDKNNTPSRNKFKMQ